MATNLYAPASIFNTAIFKLDQAGENICWFGLANNSPVNVTTSIPQGGNFRYQVAATFGSGSGLEDAQEIVKKQQTFLSKIPISKPTLNGVVPKLNKLPQNHDYIKPSSFKNEPKPFDPSGNVTGTYNTVNVPWASTYKVYLSQNFQAASDGSIMQFEVAANPFYVDPLDYTAWFDAPDFVSVGLVTRYTSNSTYALQPSNTSYFKIEFM